MHSMMVSALAAALTVAVPATVPAPTSTTAPDCTAGQARITAVQASVKAATAEATRVMALTTQPQTDARLCAAELNVRGAIKKAQTLRFNTCFTDKAAFDTFQTNLTHILDGANKVIAAYRCGR